MKDKIPNLTVESIMVTDVETITVDMTIRDAIGALLKRKISGAPVIDSVKKVISVVSQTDLMRLAVSEGLTATIGTNLKSLKKEKEVVTLSRTDTFTELYRKFLAVNYHRIIVVDGNGRVVGLVSRSAVLRILYRQENKDEKNRAAKPA